MDCKAILARMVESDLKSRDYRVFAYLTTIADEDGKIERYRHEIAKALDTVGTTVTKSMNALTDAGIIAPVRHGKSGRYTTRILP